MSGKIFKNPTEVLEAQIDDIFLKRKDDNTELIISIFSLLLQFKNKNMKKTDMAELYDLVGLDTFVSIISIFEKRTIVFPSKNEIIECITLSILYYYKEIKGMTWNEIKEIVPFKFSSISYSSKINNLNKDITKALNLAFMEKN